MKTEVNIGELDLSAPWLALMIGNSRCHWALLTGGTLQATWDTAHLTSAQVVSLGQGHFRPGAWSQAQLSPPSLASSSPLALWLASVVPSQTQLWLPFEPQVIDRHWVPLTGLYPTLGLDRILAAWGAVTSVGSPVLVVDGGTALTYTAVVGREVVGGAIAPGIRLQLQALHQGTAALPDLTPSGPPALPLRWATNTSAAIHSGVLYSVLASIHDFLAAWRRDYPHSKVVLTGGDSTFIYQHLKPFAQPVILDPQVIFKGMAACRQAGWGNGRVRK